MIALFIVSGPQILYRPLVKELEVMCNFSFDEGRYGSVSIFRNTKPFPDQKLLSADRLNITFVAPGVKVGYILRYYEPKVNSRFIE